ncbi:MAG: hypothetical protein VW102_02820 [Poseidonia sp.]|jgi:hypothetical protein
MSEKSLQSDVKAMWKWIGGSAFLASMCCFPSVVLVLFGFASVSTAAALSNDLYWGTNGMGWFRPLLSLLSLAFVAAGLVFYFRAQGVCSMEEAKRQRTRIVNTSLVVLFLSLTAYLLFNFVILTEVGIALDLPWESSRFWN